MDLNGNGWQLDRSLCTYIYHTYEYNFISNKYFQNYFVNVILKKSYFVIKVENYGHNHMWVKKVEYAVSCLFIYLRGCEAC